MTTDFSFMEILGEFGVYGFSAVVGPEFLLQCISEGMEREKLEQVHTGSIRVLLQRKQMFVALSDGRSVSGIKKNKHFFFTCLSALIKNSNRILNRRHERDLFILFLVFLNVQQFIINCEVS